MIAQQGNLVASEGKGPSDCLANIWSCSEDEDDWGCVGHDSECREISEHSGVSTKPFVWYRSTDFIISKCGISQTFRDPNPARDRCCISQTIRGGDNPAHDIDNQQERRPRR
jgi:hypothetical protein